MNALDRQIITLLSQKDYTNKQISSKLKKKPETISRHIVKLINNNTITHFYTNFNFTSLGYFQIKIYLKLYGIDDRSKEKIINYTKNKPSIIWSADIIGKYDIAFSLLVKDISEINNIYQEMITKFGEIISEKELLITQDSKLFGFDYTNSKKTKEITTYGKKTENRMLKNNEIEFIKKIQINKREHLYQITKKEDLTPEHAYYLHKKLKKEGLIQGNIPHINLNKTEYNLYKLCFYFKNYNKDLEKKLKNFITKERHITQYLRLVGHWDYELEFIVRNKNEYKEFINKFREIFKENIREYFILEIDKEYKMKLTPF